MAQSITLRDLTLLVERPTQPTRPPILFLHGLLGGAWYFDRYLHFLATRGYPGYALNLRGHHGSRQVPDIGRVSVADYVDDALEVARSLARRQHQSLPDASRAPADAVLRAPAADRSATDDPRPIVIGHSMGGLLAQKLAEAGAVRAAVLLCSAAPRGILMTGPTLFVKQIKYLPALLRSRPLRGTLDDTVDLNFNRIPKYEHERLYARFVPDSGRAGREISLGAIAVDAARVTCPVLVVGAAQDRFPPVRIARKLAAKYGAAYLEYREHAHIILREP